MEGQPLRRFSDQFSADQTEQKDRVIHQLQLLMDITRKVATYEIADNVYEMLENMVSASLNVEKTFIYTHLPEDSELYRRVFRKGSDKGYAQIGNTFDEVDECFSSGRTFCVNELTGTDYEFLEVNNFACALICSLKGEKLGVVQIINKKQGDINDSDIQQLETLAQHLGTTLPTSFRRAQEERAHQEEMALLSTVAEVTSELDLVSMIQKIILETMHLLQAERATIFLYDEESDELFSHVGIGLESKEVRIPSSHGIAGQVFTTESSINIPYAYADLRFNPNIDKQTGFFTRSILCVPLVNTKGKCIGVAQVLNKRTGPFNKDDEARLKAFTTQIAVGIENAKLFNDIQNMKNYTESMLQSMSNAVLTFDQNNQLITYNKAAESLFKLPHIKDELNNISHLISEENPWLMQEIKKVNQSRNNFDAVDTEIALSGGCRSANVHIHPLQSVEDDNLGTVVILEDITSEKRLKTTMARYLDPAVVNKLLEDSSSKLGGKSIKATLLFADIRGFTTISEKLGPPGTVELLNHFFTDMVSCIQSNNGIVNKFIGDALLAVYGAPLPVEDDADKALKSALAMSQAVREINRQQPAYLGGSNIEIGIGINTDSVVYGNVGSPKRMEFTVIGDGVNLACRIESACKFYGSRILISEHTYRALKGTYRLREVDKVIVKGKQDPIALYQVLDCYSEEEFPHVLDIVQLTREGLTQYQQQNWDKAVGYFTEIQRLFPDDPIASIYLERCDKLKINNPGDDWDGIWQMTEK